MWGSVGLLVSLWIVYLSKLNELWLFMRLVILEVVEVFDWVWVKMFGLWIIFGVLISLCVILNY